MSDIFIQPIDNKVVMFCSNSDPVLFFLSFLQSGDLWPQSMQPPASQASQIAVGLIKSILREEEF